MSDLNLTEIGTGESIINYTDHNTNYSSIETTVNNHMNDVSDFHNASGIVNDSGVTGANVDDALDELEDQIEAISSSANALIGAFSVTASGTNTYTGTFVDLTYFTDLKVLVTIPNSNTSQTVTLNINALGAKSIKYYDNDGNKQDPSIGMLKQNKSYLVQYDGTDFVLLTNAQAEIEAIEDRGVPFPIDEWIGEGTKTIWANNRDGTWEDNRWDGTAGVYSPNVLEVKVGNYGAKLTTSTNYGGIHIVKTLNLTEFEDGTASTTSDKIQLAIYTPSASYANLDTNGVNIVFANNAYTDSTDHFYYFVTKTNLTNGGWSYHEIAKSAFSEIGSPDWASVTGFSLDARATLGGEVNITIDAIQMVSASGAFQRAGSADYTINSGTWYVGWDEAYKANIFTNLDPSTSDTNALQGTKAYQDFTIDFKFIIKDPGLDSNGYGWYKDGSTDIFFYADNSTTLTLLVEDGTGSNTFNITTPTIVVNDVISGTITRNGTSVTVTANVNGTNVGSVVGDTDATGYNRNAAVPSDIVLDFGITTTERASQAAWSAKTDDITSRKQGNNLDNALSQMEGEGLTEAFRKWNYLHNVLDFTLDSWAGDAWDASGGSVADDTSIKLWGDKSIKCSMSAQNHGMHVEYVKDMSGLPDTAPTAIRIYLDAANKAKMAADSRIRVRFLCDSKPTTTNRFSKDIDKADFTNDGWNYFIIKEDDWDEYGSPSWANIKGMEIYYNSAGATAPTSSMDIYVQYDIIQRIRIDPDNSDQYSYFQKQIASGVYQNTWTWAGTGEFILGQENGDIRLKNLGVTTDLDALTNGIQYSADLKCFTFNVVTELGASVNTGYFLWYINSENYVGFFVAADDLTFRVRLSGSNTNITKTLSANAGDMLKVAIEKNENAWSLFYWINGVFGTQEFSDIISDFGSQNGNLTIGSISGRTCYIESATITSTKVANFANTSQNSKFLDNGILPYITTFTFGTATPITNIVTNFRYSVSEQGICKGWAYYKADDGQNASSLTISLPVAPKNNGNTNMPCVSQEKVNATWTNPLAYIDDSGSIIEFRSFSTATTGQAFIISVFFEYEIE
jgi:hypothetical protein